MPATNPIRTPNPEPTSTLLDGGSTAHSEKIRRLSAGKEPGILADIYQEEVNIAIWQRDLSETCKTSVSEFLLSRPGVQLSMSVTPQGVLSNIQESLGSDSPSELNEDIAKLVDMFCCLFELKRTGLRLTALDRAMCPRFHVDRVPGRLITTYQGVATEWLPHQRVNRTKLGAGNKGQADNQSGLFQTECDIQQLTCGDVAILWEGNENAGLVHRSPALPAGQSRLLLTLDFGS